MRSGAGEKVRKQIGLGKAGNFKEKIIYMKGVFDE